MKTKFRVLHCIRQGQVGGGETHLLSLVAHHNPELYEPVVLSFTDGPMVAKLRQMGIETHVLHTEVPFDMRVWRKLQTLIRTWKIDLIHAHGTRAHSNIFFPARRLSIPLIYTVHGWSFHPGQPLLVRSLRKWTERFLTRNAQVNIAVSHASKRTGRETLGAFDARVIRNGIDLGVFNTSRSFKSVRNELGIAADAVLVLFVARFTHQKQPLALIRSFAAAQRADSRLHLLMVGDGDQKAEAVSLIEQLNLMHKITMQPFRSDVPDVLHAADIYVLPSLWEGLPIGLLEAMAMQKAVIATRVDGTAEVVDNNINGILIDPAALEPELTEAMLCLAHNSELRQLLASKAAETVGNDYNAAVMTQKVEDVYIQLAGKCTPKTPINKSNMEFERYTDQKRLQFIADTLRQHLPKGAVVLDVGCGNGVISRSLGALGFNVTGIDVSKRAIAKARELNVYKNVSFEVKSAEALMAGSERYHAVVCSEVLEHLNEPSALLKVLRQILLPQGVLIVTVPNGAGPRELFVTRPVIALQQSNSLVWKFVKGLKGVLGYKGTTVQSDADDLTHVQFFTREALLDMAAATSFRVVRLGKTNFMEDVFPFSLLTRRIRKLQQWDCAFAELLPVRLTGGFVTVWEKQA